MPRRRGSTRGARGIPGRQSHSVVDTRTPGSQSHTETPGSQSHTATPGSQRHTTTPGSQSHTATPGSQLDSHSMTPKSQSHTRRRTPWRQSHRSTPATLGTGRIQKYTRSRTRRQVSNSHNREPIPLNTDTSPSSSAS